MNNYQLYKHNITLLAAYGQEHSEIWSKVMLADACIVNKLDTSQAIIITDNLKEISNGVLSQLNNSYCEWFSEHAQEQDVVKFVYNYGADQVWFTQYLSLIAAKAPERAAIEIFTNLYNEVNSSNDYTQFHPNLFRKLYNAYNLVTFNRFDFTDKVNEKTYACINAFLLSTKLSYLTGAGAIYVLEKTIPAQLNLVLKRLKTANLPRDALIFFEVHATVDINHAHDWWENCIQPFLNSAEQLKELVLGINLGLYARNLLWEGLDETSTRWQY